MTYLLKDNRKNKSKFFKVSVLAGILIFARIILPSFFSGVANFAVRPFWNFKKNISSSFSYTSAMISSRKNIVELNQKLSDEKNESDLKLIRLDILTKENNDLKEMLGRKSQNQNSILAYVLVKPPQSFYDNLVLDAGTNLGVQKGDKVMASDGIIIGEISEAYSNTSTAKIFSSSGQKMDAVIERGNVPVSLEGAGNGSFETKLPKESDIKVGDYIVAIDGSGAVLGKVQDIETTDNDSFQRVLIKGPFNIFQIRSVLIQKTN
jgi:rod shape-determining protein MreC